MNARAVRLARIVVSSAIFLGLFGAIGALSYIGRDGGLSDAKMNEGVKSIVTYFVPILGTLIGFYFAGRTPKGGARADSGSPEAIIIGIGIIVIWAWLPMALLLVTATYESAVRHLDATQLYGSLVGFAALTFFFSTTRKD